MRAHDRGYATPAALVLSLGFAMIGAAMAARGLHGLALARAELERARLTAALDGAQLLAAATVVRSGAAGPFAWRFSSEDGWLRAEAEREADKAGLAAAAGAADLMTALGVADAAALQARLAQAASGPAPVDVAALDAAPLWRSCAASVVSAQGEAEAPAYADHAAPTPAPERPADWRIGEVWRIQVATPAGWRDERIVRFTGDARRPVAIVARRLSRARGDGAECEPVLKAALGGQAATTATP